MPDLRLTTRADMDAVDRLLALSYPRLLAADYPASILVTALPRITRAKPELLTSGSYFILTEGKETLAVGGWTRGAPGTGAADTPTLGHIRHVAAHPDHLRQGHCRGLMTHALAQARAQGIRTLDCLSTRTAVPFYAALGFETIGPVDVPLAPGITFPSIRMGRSL